MNERELQRGGNGSYAEDRVEIRWKMENFVEEWGMNERILRIC